MNAFDTAAQVIGLNESDKVAALRDYLTTGGQNLDPATTAWCAAFVNASLQHSGGTGTGSNMARSFLDWGQEVNEPQVGDIAVFSRGDPNGPFGHVGFFQGYNPDGTINVLGGNQGDAVSIASYSPDRLLGFRRQGNALANTPPIQPQNALAGGVAPQTPPTNALRPQIGQMDPSAFMVATPPARKFAFS